MVKSETKMILDFFKAMRLGEEVGNPAKWKRNQNKAIALAGLVVLGLKYAMPDTVIPDDIVNMISTVIFYIVLIANYFITIATTKKIGLTTEHDNNNISH
jgi:hypothetical protein